ncbi:MAG: hypothetical protein EON59_08035 [Alphaproteobacteria bacterium]|nr:MAG: hypothetical protein EON59_08035 [Alphaproteobacteria bacterium]
MPQGGAPVTPVDKNGNALGTTGDTATAPSFHRSVGGSTINTGQATSSVSPANATLIVAARAGRQSVVLSNITGTQPVFFIATAGATGATTGFFLAGTVGASITIATAAAIYATSPTAAQTVSFLENY